MRILLKILVIIGLAVLLSLGYEYFQTNKKVNSNVRVERNIMKDDINQRIENIESQGGEIMDVQIEDQMNVDTYTIIYKN